MTQIFQRLYVFVLGLTMPFSDKRDSGQATSEYALVMLAAALIALLVIAWATGGGGAGKIGELFDRVIDSVTSKLP
jgi:Flp pilus assembly pilin Flp